jgi:hypothetical protein
VALFCGFEVIPGRLDVVNGYALTALMFNSKPKTILRAATVIAFDRYQLKDVFATTIDEV